MIVVADVSDQQPPVMQPGIVVFGCSLDLKGVKVTLITVIKNNKASDVCTLLDIFSCDLWFNEVTFAYVP